MHRETAVLTPGGACFSLLRPAKYNPAFKPRASQQNFAVAISAETDHFDAAMILEHKGYSIEAFATPTMTWSEAEQEKYRLLGPYESFQSRTDAEAWEPLSSC